MLAPASLGRGWPPRKNGGLSWRDMLCRHAPWPRQGEWTVKGRRRRRFYWKDVHDGRSAKKFLKKVCFRIKINFCWHTISWYSFQKVRTGPVEELWEFLCDVRVIRTFRYKSNREFLKIKNYCGFLLYGGKKAMKLLWQKLFCRFYVKFISVFRSWSRGFIT